METKFTNDALSNTRINSEGHVDVITDKGKHVLTMIHPVQFDEHPIPEEDLKRFQADLRLHQYAGSLFDTLDIVRDVLEDLRTGKITIFNMPLMQMLEECNTVLKRASKID